MLPSQGTSSHPLAGLEDHRRHVADFNSGTVEFGFRWFICYLLAEFVSNKDIMHGKGKRLDRLPA